MSYYKLPPNYYLQIYPPPSHPPPPPTLHTIPQKFLRFREFHNTHFIQNRLFFQHSFNPTTPWWLWKVEGEEGVGEEAVEGGYYQQQQAENYTDYGYQEKYYEGEETEDPKVEFVLSEEAIAMFRFSELRRQQRKLVEFLLRAKKLVFTNICIKYFLKLQKKLLQIYHNHLQPMMIFLTQNLILY
jgi:hypothetical protein